MDQTEEMAITVDLSDIAAIVVVVKSVLSLETCIDHSKLLQKGSKVSIVMTSTSWQAATEQRKVDAKEDLPRMLKHMGKKQDLLEHSVEKILAWIQSGVDAHNGKSFESWPGSIGNNHMGFAEMATGRSSLRAGRASSGCLQLCR